MIVDSVKNKEEKLDKQTEITVTEIKPTVTIDDSRLPLWIPGEYSKVVIVFGHGYETQELQERDLNSYKMLCAKCNEILNEK